MIEIVLLTTVAKDRILKRFMKLNCSTLFGNHCQSKMRK